MPNPQRREIWTVDLGMMAKVRPAIVVSVTALESDRAIVTIIPHTTSTRNSQFEVNLSVAALRPGAFDCQNLLTVPSVKFLRKLGVVSATDMIAIESGIMRWLGLHE